MEGNPKIAKHYSVPLMKQNVKSKWVLTLVMILISCMLACVVSIAMNTIDSVVPKDTGDAQTDFFTHLSAIAVYNQMAGADLSPADFLSAADKSAYEAAFDAINAQSPDMDLSVERFAASAQALAGGDGGVDSYVEQFEYTYALMDEKGAFTGKDLTIDGMMDAMLGAMGISPTQIERMANLDPTAMMNRMYFTIMGIIPLLLFVVIVGNSLIVDQVDSGSMAYVLATPTKRAAVANTQALFLIVSPLIICAVTCLARIAVSAATTGDGNVVMNLALFGGMYVLTEAFGGICYMGSCLFNRKGRATAFGGGVAVWCFIASLLGMFGSPDMVDMGMGVESLGRFNNMTLIGLFDIDALSTVGSDSVDYAFAWKLCVLAGIAVVTYAVGKLRFQKKDLPL